MKCDAPCYLIKSPGGWPKFGTLNLESLIKTEQWSSGKGCHEIFEKNKWALKILNLYLCWCFCQCFSSVWRMYRFVNFLDKNMYSPRSFLLDWFREFVTLNAQIASETFTHYRTYLWFRKHAKFFIETEWESERWSQSQVSSKQTSFEL